jgi:acetyltransferase-like isoleucine patch superfamily enzyme
VKIWCVSDDYANDLITIIPDGAGPIKEHLIVGDVTFGDCTAVGSNTVVMPGNHVPEGTSIGALSFVPPQFPFEPWAVYAGIPLRRVADRNRDAVSAQAALLRKRLTAMMKRT